MSPDRRDRTRLDDHNGYYRMIKYIGVVFFRRTRDRRLFYLLVFLIMVFLPLHHLSPKLDDFYSMFSKERSVYDRVEPAVRLNAGPKSGLLSACMLVISPSEKSPNETLFVCCTSKLCKAYPVVSP